MMRSAVLTWWRGWFTHKLVLEFDTHWYLVLAFNILFMRHTVETIVTACFKHLPLIQAIKTQLVNLLQDIFRTL